MAPRKGFTLVEMMVSLALVLFIMVILSEAFVAGLDAFHRLKAIGDLDEKGRSAAMILRRDLSAQHFGGIPERLSALTSSTIPQEGFFRIEAPGLTDEGQDPDGVHSYRQQHRLHFSINLSRPPVGLPTYQKNRQENYFIAHVGNTTLTQTMGPAAYRNNQDYFSQWVEAAYFLRDLGIATPADSGGNTLPLYALYRRQLVVLDPDDAQTMNQTQMPTNDPTNNPGSNWRNADGNFLYYEVSCEPESDKLHFNSPADLRQLSSNRRALYYNDPAPYPILTDRNEKIELRGADLLLTDVLSFTVRVLKVGKSGWESVDGNFDTGDARTYQIAALEIIIRVWDVKTQQTRQITVLQEM